MNQTAEDFEDIRVEVRRLCDRYGNEYWRGLEPDRYPEEFVTELASQGWLGSLIPEQYGGGGVDYWYNVVLLEELGRADCASVPMGIAVHTGVLAHDILNGLDGGG